MYRLATSLALVVLALLTPPARAAGLSPCTTAVGKAVEKYVKLKRQAIAKCEDKRSAGTLPPATNCRPAAGAVTDQPTAAKLAAAAAAVQSTIGAACPGPLPPLGPPCNSKTTAALLATCITSPTQDTDVDNVNIDILIGAVYDANAPVTDVGLRKCQAAISKAGGNYLLKRLKSGRTCQGKRALGTVAACPDAKTAAALEKARANMDKAIRKKCTEAQLAPTLPDDPKLVFGFPCEAYTATSFRRAGTLPVLDKAIRCLTDAHAGVADYTLSIAFPGPELSAFAQGVAAGDATDTSAIFWTRLPDANAGASLDVSTDATFPAGPQTQTIAVSSPPGTDGTAKADVGGLSAATEYFYRFRQGSDTSRTGRVVTAPAPSDTMRIARIAWTGDLNAWYLPATSLDPLRLLNPDAFLFIGDTIYGDDPRSDGITASTFDDYAAKYKGNLADQSLRDLSAATGTYKQWDDHEVRNDFAGAGIVGPAFAAKLAAGNLAFRRYAPLRENVGDPMQLYRSVRWGAGAEFFLIDDRQYRSAKYTCCTNAPDSGFVTTDADSTCAGGMAGEALLPSPACSGPTAMGDPSRTILGATQKQWLKDGLMNSTATFKFIMNGPPMTELLFLPYDRWEAWIAERNEILDFIQTNAITNVVWLSTDLHAVVISPDHLNTDDATHPGVEFVVGSIAENTLFRELPASIVPLLETVVPGLIAQVDDDELDRYNGVLITIDPAAGTAKIDIYDKTGLLIDSRTLP